MLIKEIAIIRRQNGYFHFNDQVIPAVRPGDGFGVALILDPSQVDQDFGVPILFLTAKQIEDITKALDRSDNLTFEMLKRPWKGERPRPLTVEDFV